LLIFDADVFFSLHDVISDYAYCFDAAATLSLDAAYFLCHTLLPFRCQLFSADADITYNRRLRHHHTMRMLPPSRTPSTT